MVPVMSKSKELTELASLRTVKMNPEHQKEFDVIFQTLLNDLDSFSALSIVLVEQIAECMFWIKQHNKDKEEIIYFAMGEVLVKGDSSVNSYGLAPLYARVIKAVIQGSSDLDKTKPGSYQLFDKAMNQQGHTIASLRAKAIVYRLDKINDLDSVISRHIQNLRHLQKGLDAFDIKKRMLKRLDLEIEQLQQKNDALEYQPQKTLS